MAQNAELIERHYSSGKTYYIVECYSCHIVLNSGHHYTFENVHHAEALVLNHNTNVHL